MSIEIPCQGGLLAFKKGRESEVSRKIHRVDFYETLLTAEMLMVLVAGEPVARADLGNSAPDQ